MGGEREARALAAGDVIEVKEGEKLKRYKLRPVASQQLCDLERDALRYYQRQYLQTYRDNADLLGKDDSRKLMREKLDEVARWDISYLPQKDVYDTSQTPVTNELKQWLKDEYSLEETDEDSQAVTEATMRALLSMAIDSDRITPKRVKEMTGKAPGRARVRFDQWWITGLTEGMVSFITASVRMEHPEITHEKVAGWPLSKLTEASRIVERLTAASVGNG